MTADKPTKNQSSTKSKVKPIKSKVKPTKSKVKPKKTKVNPKKSKIKSTKGKLKSTKSKVKSKKSKVEPDVVYYRTDGGYYYKQTQNGGFSRVSKAEYMEGGNLDDLLKSCPRLTAALARRSAVTRDIEMDPRDAAARRAHRERNAMRAKASKNKQGVGEMGAPVVKGLWRRAVGAARTRAGL